MKKAFTLIELLVVIAIIAILAAILFPVFAQAKEAAKKSSDLSNVKQQGTSMALYLSDSDDVYPSAYYYNNDNNSSNGYTHWSGMLMPYVKNLQIFVSPGDTNGALAPSNYIVATNNGGYGTAPGQTSQNPTVQDNQAPRLSYTVNAAIMPRKRRTVDPSNVVSATAVDNVANIILIAPMTSKPSCINDSSAASGVAFKSHRSANPFFLPGTTTPFAGEATAEIGLGSYLAATEAQVRAAFVTCNASSALNQLHIVYTAPNRFNRSGTDLIGGNANYGYADTHAKNSALSRTLQQGNYQWATRNYGAGGGIITKTDGVTQVGG